MEKIPYQGEFAVGLLRSLFDGCGFDGPSPPGAPLKLSAPLLAVKPGCTVYHDADVTAEARQIADILSKADDVLYETKLHVPGEKLVEPACIVVQHVDGDTSGTAKSHVVPLLYTKRAGDRRPHGPLAARYVPTTVAATMLRLREAAPREAARLLMLATGHTQVVFFLCKLTRDDAARGYSVRYVPVNEADAGKYHIVIAEGVTSALATALVELLPERCAFRVALGLSGDLVATPVKATADPGPAPSITRNAMRGARSLLRKEHNLDNFLKFRGLEPIQATNVTEQSTHMACVRVLKSQGFLKGYAPSVSSAPLFPAGSFPTAVTRAPKKAKKKPKRRPRKKLTPQTLACLATLAELRAVVYGGFARDYIAGEPFNDIDCFVAAQEDFDSAVDALGLTRTHPRTCESGKRWCQAEGTYEIDGKQVAIELTDRSIWEPTPPDYDVNALILCFDGHTWQPRLDSRGIYAGVLSEVLGNVRKRVAYLCRPPGFPGHRRREKKIIARGYTPQ